jgi:hypothetical protein
VKGGRGRASGVMHARRPLILRCATKSKDEYLLVKVGRMGNYWIIGVESTKLKEKSVYRNV